LERKAGTSPMMIMVMMMMMMMVMMDVCIVMMPSEPIGRQGSGGGEYFRGLRRLDLSHRRWSQWKDGAGQVSPLGKAVSPSIHPVISLFSILYSFHYSQFSIPLDDDDDDDDDHCPIQNDTVADS